MPSKRFDGSQATFPKLLQQGGYQTAVIGKWHLETDPTGFDHWEILPGQGSYYNPDIVMKTGTERRPNKRAGSHARWHRNRQRATATKRPSPWLATPSSESFAHSRSSGRSKTREEDLQSAKAWNGTPSIFGPPTLPGVRSR